VTLAGDGEPISWLDTHAAQLRSHLVRHGGVLVTGLGVHGPRQLAAARQALGSRPATTVEDFAERLAFGDGVYTAPEWGAEREMCMHHELAHGIEFPGLLVMACPKPPVSGGAILLGDTRAVLRELPVALVDRFRARGWNLVRNYRPYLGLSWVTAFGAVDPVEVEAICAERLTGCAWLPDGILRTVQHRSAVVHHPISGDACWFNQIAFFSQWSLPPDQRGLMLSEFGAYGMPFNTVYGDATELAEDEFTSMLEAYDRVLVRVDLRPGDLLLVDNVNTAHGRDPFTGEREVLVALADPVRLADCAPTVSPMPDFASPAPGGAPG
jgi:hypothetical protein